MMWCSRVACWVSVWWVYELCDGGGTGKGGGDGGGGGGGGGEVVVLY